MSCRMQAWILSLRVVVRCAVAESRLAAGVFDVRKPACLQIHQSLAQMSQDVIRQGPRQSCGFMTSPSASQGEYADAAFSEVVSKSLANTVNFGEAIVLGRRCAQGPSVYNARTPTSRKAAV